MEYYWRSVDLNLLTILHALLEEGHVSRAAVRLGLSQPATSSALERCRQLFGDPLLERRGSRMRLTAKAAALRQPLAEVMDRIGGLLSLEPPALRDIQRVVHIVMADALSIAISRTLRDSVAAAAPGVDLVIHPWSGGSATLDQLARGSVDLAISVLPEVDGHLFHTEAVLQERYVVAMRAGHPAASTFNLEQWLAWPHVIVSAEGATRTLVDDTLAAIGRARRIGMVVPGFITVPDLLRASDLIALLPATVLSGAAGCGIARFDPPLALDGFTIRLAWHRRREHDIAVRYVASEVKRLLQAQRPDGPAECM